MEKQKVETRGLPSEFYVTASLLRALSLIEKTINQRRDTIDSVIVRNGKEDLDRIMRTIEQVNSHSRNSDGKWSKPLKKTKKFKPETMFPVPNNIRRKAISDKNSKVRVMDALIAYYISSDYYLMDKSKLSWKDFKTKEGVAHRVTFSDCQSPNDHIIVIKCGTTEFQILLSGVARSKRALRKKKKVGKTNVDEASKNVESMSIDGGDASVNELSKGDANVARYKDTILRVESMTSSSSSGYQMGD